MPLVHLGCPSCGGTLSLAEGQRIVSCRYCGGESLALIPGAVPRYAVVLGIDREGARTAAQRFLAGSTLPRALRERGRVQDLSLCYVPFYEFTGIRLGTFLLKEGVKPPAPQTERGAEDSEFQRWLLEPPRVREETRVVQQEFVSIGSACDLPELGTDTIRLERLRRGPAPAALEPYDLVALQSRAVVFAPTKPPGRFAEDVQWRIRVKGDRTGVVEQRLKILYYPVWQARYRHAGRPYEIAVDGVTGSILHARAPVDVRRAVALTVTAIALAAFCFGRPGRELFRAGVAGGDPSGWVVGTVGSLVGLGLGGVVALFLAWVGWETSRQGGEAVHAEESGGPVLSSGWGSGPLGDLTATVTRWLLSPRTRPPTQT